MREWWAVVTIIVFVVVSLHDAHRKTMPVVGGVVSVVTLLAFFPFHIAGDPKLKMWYTDRAVGMGLSLVLLLGSLTLLHVRGKSFKTTHAMWHAAVFTFIGLVALQVPCKLLWDVPAAERPMKGEVKEKGVKFNAVDPVVRFA